MDDYKPIDQEVESAIDMSNINLNQSRGENSVNNEEETVEVVDMDDDEMDRLHENQATIRPE